MTPPRIALLGDLRDHVSHRELDSLRMRLDAHTEWVPTDSGTDVTAFDGVWLVPGSPYADDAAVYAALRAVRRAGVPFLGTCGGLQYAAISFLRDIAGVDATHEESDAVEGVDGHAVRTLACDLQFTGSTLDQWRDPSGMLFGLFGSLFFLWRQSRLLLRFFVTLPYLAHDLLLVSTSERRCDCSIGRSVAGNRWKKNMYDQP